jgi:thioredoxin 1
MMTNFSRRTLIIAGLASALAAPALAQDSGGTIPGFDEALAAGGPVLMHTTATWCEVCQAQKPIVSSLLATPDFSAMKVFEVDFDTQKDVLRRYNVQRQSTMIIYKAGQEVDRQVGQTDPVVIESFLRKAL